MICSNPTAQVVEIKCWQSFYQKQSSLGRGINNICQHKSCRQCKSCLVCLSSQWPMNMSAELPHSSQLCSFSSESVYGRPSEFTLSPQQVAQAHSRILHLEPLCGVKVQTGHLLCLEVGYAVEPPAFFFWSLQFDREGRSVIPLHLQLQHSCDLILSHAHVTHIHVQNVGSSAVDVDLPVNHIYILAV